MVKSEIFRLIEAGEDVNFETWLVKVQLVVLHYETEVENENGGQDVYIADWDLRNGI